MCGRYTLACSDEEALRRGLPFDAFSDTRIEFRPRYNIAPGQHNPVVYLVDGEPVLRDTLWGLERKGGGILVNARSETAERARRFRDAFREGRCLVPADGFFEWRREGGTNQPYLFRPTDGGLLLMAGLVEDDRYVVLTEDANEQVSPVHRRMPVQLEPGAARRWLESGELGERRSLVHRAVSPRVNRVDHDDPECIAPPAQSDLPFDD